MRLLKAFIRSIRVDEVVRALEGAGAPGITVSQVHGVGYGYEPRLFSLSPREVSKMPKVAKIEVVCSDEEVRSLIDTLATSARTGYPGDGIVFVTPVTHAVKIRTGKTGAQALRNHDGP